MYNLIKLEVRKNNLKGYIKASIVSLIVILGFTYFVSTVAKIEQEEAFQNYENIFLFTSFICVLYFSVLTTVMFSRIVIEAYRGKKMMLLYSYPVSRTNVFLSKIYLVTLLNVGLMLVSYIFSLAVFTTTELISPIVSTELTFRVVSLAVLKIVPLTMTVVGLSIIAMAIGFIKKSVQTAIVSIFILVGIFGNVASSSSNLWVSYCIALTIGVVSIFVLKYLIRQINRMEVE